MPGIAACAPDTKCCERWGGSHLAEPHLAHWTAPGTVDDTWHLGHRDASLDRPRHGHAPAMAVRLHGCLHSCLSARDGLQPARPCNLYVELVIVCPPAGPTWQVVTRLALPRWACRNLTGGDWCLSQSVPSAMHSPMRHVYMHGGTHMHGKALLHASRNTSKLTLQSLAAAVARPRGSAQRRVSARCGGSARRGGSAQRGACSHAWQVSFLPRKAIDYGGQPAKHAASAGGGVPNGATAPQTPLPSVPLSNSHTNSAKHPTEPQPSKPLALTNVC
mmetsp:Transcript_6291/g.19457  ORF Transcript_6291/g.19457 Transcript_6291/m.19457 type:complete len:275 (-) Transcript_6291:1154-1978(-)